MDLPQEADDFIKESIQYSPGLSVSETSLALKLQAYEEAQRRLRDQLLLVLAKLKEKDGVMERAGAEASMNAQALKKFVDENQKLAKECSNLSSQCSKLEEECSLFDKDREALMDFCNEADGNAKEAEIRVRGLKEEVRKLSEEIRSHKDGSNVHMGNSSEECSVIEEQLLKSIVSSLMTQDEVAQNALSFLEANSGVESCGRLLKMWNILTSSSQIALSLAAELSTLQQDKDRLRVNLQRAEGEVKALFEENNTLDGENKRLFGQCHRERNHPDSGKRTSSDSAKENKRKSSAKMSNPAERKIEFNDFGSPRRGLSPLLDNTPDPIMHKQC